MRAFFVSDIHLKDQNEPRSILLLRLVRSMVLLRERQPEQITHLFLLGDIFDLWVADHDYFTQKFENLVESLRRLRKLGVEIHYFEGNHDFHLKGFWEKKMGFRVHTDAAEMSLGPYDLRIEHGDMMNPEEKSYRLLRWFWRSWLIKNLAIHVPGALVGAIGERSSIASRKRSTKVRQINKGDLIGHMHRHAEIQFQLKPYDFLFSGHTHVLDDYELPGPKAHGRLGRFVNLGSWFEEPKLGVLSDSGFEFVPVQTWIEQLPQGPSTV